MWRRQWKRRRPQQIITRGVWPQPCGSCTKTLIPLQRNPPRRANVAACRFFCHWRDACERTPNLRHRYRVNPRHHPHRRACVVRFLGRCPHASRSCGPCCCWHPPGDLSQRVTVQGRDEIGLLAMTFNHMAASLDQMTQAQQQRLTDLLCFTCYWPGHQFNPGPRSAHHPGPGRCRATPGL